MSAVPTVPARQFDFNSFSTNNPTAQQPGVQIDAELNALRAWALAINSRLSEIQRADGAILNQSVGPDQLSGSVLIGLTPPAPWASGHAYTTSSMVANGSTLYICNTAHTSGVSFDVTKFTALLNFSIPLSLDGSTLIALSVATASVANAAITYAKIQATSQACLLGSSAAGVVSEQPASSLGLAVLAAANSAAAQTALGFGNAAMQNVSAFAAALHTHTLSQILDAGSAASHPSTDFAPVAHSHVANDITERSGAVMQSAYNENTAYATGTTAIPQDNTIPQITEGTQILSVAITPVRSDSKIRIRIAGNVYMTAAYHLSTAVFRDSNANAIAACSQGVTTQFVPLSLEYQEATGSTASRTYSVRIGADSTSGAWWINGNNSGQLFGGASRCTLIVEEIRS